MDGIRFFSSRPEADSTICRVYMNSALKRDLSRGLASPATKIVFPLVFCVVGGEFPPGEAMQKCHRGY
jgi:hypothetical protein